MWASAASWDNQTTGAQPPGSSDTVTDQGSAGTIYQILGGQASAGEAYLLGNVAIEGPLTVPADSNGNGILWAGNVVYPSSGSTYDNTDAVDVEQGTAVLANDITVVSNFEIDGPGAGTVSKYFQTLPGTPAGGG